MDEQDWQNLPATERDNYLQFHRDAYKEDLGHAEEVLLKFPRWSIISGYYAMHDLTKYFLALKICELSGRCEYINGWKEK